MMDPWTAILTKAGDYGPWGLVIAALAMALVWATLRNARLQDMRADDGKLMTTALLENKNATEKFTAAMASRTDTMNDWSRQMTAMVDAMKGLQTSQTTFIQTLAERDRDSRHAERERGAR